MRRIAIAGESLESDDGAERGMSRGRGSIEMCTGRSGISGALRHVNWNLEYLLRDWTLQWQSNTAGS